MKIRARPFLKNLFILLIALFCPITGHGQTNTSYITGYSDITDSTGAPATHQNLTIGDTSWNIVHTAQLPLSPGMVELSGYLTSGDNNSTLLHLSHLTAYRWPEQGNNDPGAVVGENSLLTVYVLGPLGTPYIAYGENTEQASFGYWVPSTGYASVGQGIFHQLGDPDTVGFFNQTFNETITRPSQSGSGDCQYYSGFTYCKAFIIRSVTSLNQGPFSPYNNVRECNYFGALNLTIVVAKNGYPFNREPGNDDGPQMCGALGAGGAGSTSNRQNNFVSGDESTADEFCTLNTRTRNVDCTVKDPVTTRTSPLINNIHVSSQVVETARSMANATFTYDMHVALVTLYNLSNVGTPHIVLVDGDGTRFDFGSPSSPVRPVRVFSTLTQTGGGFTLSNAGPPEHIEKAGNFSYDFDVSGKLTLITDPAGNTKTFTYSSGLLTQATDTSTGRNITYNYTGSRITTVTDNGSGTVTTISYTNNRVTNIAVGSNPSTAYQMAFEYTTNIYQPQNLQLSKVTRDNDPNSALNITYDWVPAGNKMTVRPADDPQVAFVPLAKVSTIYGATPITSNESTLSGTKTKTSVTNADGGVETFYFDVNGNLVRLEKPQYTGGTAPLTYTFSYDANGALTGIDDGTRSEALVNNSYGLMTSHTDSIDRETTYTYSGVNLTEIEDEVGTVLTIGYTDINHPGHPNIPKTVTDAGGHSWSFTLNDFGQITGVAPPAGSEIGASTAVYEESSSSPNYGYLKSITNGAGDLVTYDSYSVLGDPLEVSTYSDSNNLSTTKHTTTFQYDAARRMTLIEHPDDKQYSLTYGGRNLSATEDEAGTDYTHTMDSCCDLPTELSGPLSWVLRWERDRDSKIKKFTDTRAHDTNYTFGANGELTGIDYPDSTRIDYLYDNFGRLRRITNGRSQQKNVTYNDADEVTAVSYPISSTSEGYTYRTDGLLETATDSTGTTTYSYNSSRLLQLVTYNLGTSGLTPLQKVEYTYNPDNTRATMTWKNNNVTVASWSYGYDGSGRMTSVTGPDGTVNYAYDNEGKLLAQVNPNNTTITYGYNQNRGWVTNIEHKLTSTNSVFGSYGLQYDSGNNTVGNITLVDELGSDQVTYQYDALYRITQEVRSGGISYTRNYGYDLAGNLETLGGATYSVTFGTYDSANKFASVNGGYANYDGDGNLTGISGVYILLDQTYDSPSGEPIFIPAARFYWDERNKLSQHVIQNNETNFGYNYQGKRVWGQPGGSSAVRKFYVFDGDRLIGELYGSTPAPTVAYTWGADGLASQRLIGATSSSVYYQFGAQGETRFLTNSSGTILNSYYYNAYGRVLTSTGTTYNKHLYGGKFGYYSDGGMGMMLAGQRWYSSFVMKWLSRDPIKYRGGDNLYGYVGENPVLWTDPSGENPVIYVLWTLFGIIANELSDPTETDKPTTAKDELLHGIHGGLAGYACTGSEIVLSKNLRIAPFGNRRRNPIGWLPHYHRRIRGPNGITLPGGGIGRHRPWE